MYVVEGPSFKTSEARDRSCLLIEITLPSRSALRRPSAFLLVCAETAVAEIKIVAIKIRNFFIHSTLLLCSDDSSTRAHSVAQSGLLQRGLRRRGAGLDDAAAETL